MTAIVWTTPPPPFCHLYRKPVRLIQDCDAIIKGITENFTLVHLISRLIYPLVSQEETTLMVGYQLLNLYLYIYQLNYFILVNCIRIKCRMYKIHCHNCDYGYKRQQQSRGHCFPYVHVFHGFFIPVYVVLWFYHKPTMLYSVMHHRKAGRWKKLNL